MAGTADEDSSETTRRGRQARDRADRAGKRAAAAADRLKELRGAGDPQRDDEAPTPQAAELAERSRHLALESARNAAAAARSSADMHDSAARLHHQSAEAGLGDVAEHRRLAEKHERDAVADRAEALVDDRLGEQIRQRLDPGREH